MIGGQTALQRALQDAFQEAKLRNPQFSLRAFARRLGLAPSALSEVLNGKRRVSKKLASRVIQRLALDPKESEAILGLFPENRKSDPRHPSFGQSLKLLELSADQFRLIGDWYHFAILSLAETRDFEKISSSPSAIASRLGIKETEAEQAIERLVRLGLLAETKNPSGQSHFKITGQGVKTPDEVANLALRKFHSQVLELARSSLHQDPVELRDFTAVTMAIDPARLPEAKKMIREFGDRLMDYLESGEKTEVYKFAVNLFPVTRSGE